MLRHRVVLSLSFLLSYLDLENLDQKIAVEVSSSSDAVPFTAPLPDILEISEGRYRAQSCKATLELLSPLPKKLTGECSVREIFNLLLIFCGEVLWVQIPLSDQKFKSVNTQMIALLLHCTIDVNWKSRNSAHPFHLMFYLRRMVSWITNSVFQLAPVTNQTAY